MASFTRMDEEAWRALAQAASDPDASPELLLTRVKATAGRVIPCERRRDQSAFVALQALARAAGEGTKARRLRLSGCLADLAADCAKVGGWSLQRESLRATGLALSRASLEFFEV
jgi:hypothetical protein